MMKSRRSKMMIWHHRSVGVNYHDVHGAWKSQEKSHFTSLRANRSILIGEKCQKSKIQMRHFGRFSNNMIRMVFILVYCGIWIFAPKHKVNYFVMTSSWSQATLIVQAEQDKSNEKKLAEPGARKKVLIIRFIIDRHHMTQFMFPY